TERRSAGLLSYLLFEPVYLERLIALGRADAHARRADVLAFFGLEGLPARGGRATRRPPRLASRVRSTRPPPAPDGACRRRACAPRAPRAGASRRRTRRAGPRGHPRGARGWRRCCCRAPRRR